MKERCYCGDPDCPVCGPLQGYGPEYDSGDETDRQYDIYRTRLLKEEEHAKVESIN